MWTWKPSASSQTAANSSHRRRGPVLAGGAAAARWDAGGNSTQRSATTASTSAALAAAKGTNGEASRSRAVSTGATAPARPMPSSDANTRNDEADPCSRRAMITMGGARRAEEVAAHKAVRASSSTGEEAAGSSTNASAETTDSARIHPPSRRMPLATRSAAMPSARSMATKITWSITRIHATCARGMPACAASCGRNAT
ncbi:hypothetical protein D3C72_1324340 [compost metagenome]